VLFCRGYTEVNLILRRAEVLMDNASRERPDTALSADDWREMLMERAAKQEIAVEEIVGLEKIFWREQDPHWLAAFTARSRLCLWKGEQGRKRGDSAVKRKFVLEALDWLKLDPSPGSKDFHRVMRILNDRCRLTHPHGGPDKGRGDLNDLAHTVVNTLKRRSRGL
jgi:hypothetical protein